MKRLALFCDGTWNELSDEQRPSTNVVLLAKSVASIGTDAHGQLVQQIVFYDDGVGTTGASVDGWTEKLLGGAFGAGLTRNVEDAYRFLIFNYDPGDEIYIFGFSRGAFTARSIVGLLNKCSILRQDKANYIGRAIALYRNRDVGPNDDDAVNFRADFGLKGIWLDKKDTNYKASGTQRLRVHFLGVWDTVGSLGLPEFNPIVTHLNKDKYTFHDTKLSRTVKTARHAVALNERRKAFAPTIWENLVDLMKRESEDENGGADYAEMWFPGDHGSVGGGGDIDGLSKDALRWIADAAAAEGLALAGAPHAPFGQRDANDHLVSLENISAELRNRLNGTPFKKAFSDFMTILPKKDRAHPGKGNVSALSDSALLRWRDDASFRKTGTVASMKLAEHDVAVELKKRGLS